MLKRGEIANDLLMYHPNAFLLLTLIAMRARRTPNLIKNLDICECQLGDYKACGLTEQKYRTAKNILEKLNLATFETTNKGTIGKLINTDIYNINPESCNGQTNNQITNEQRTDNEQVTTNNNVNKENNDKNVNNYSDEIKNFTNNYQEYVLNAFPKTAPKITTSLIQGCCDTIDKLIRLDNFTFKEIYDSIQWASNDDFWSDQILSLAQLRKKAGNGNKKFVNMFTAYQKKDFKPLNKAEERTQSNIQAGEDFVNGF